MLSTRFFLCRLATVIAGVVVLGPCLLVIADDRPQNDSTPSVWSMGGVQPLLTKYCARCHNDEKHEGEFHLTAFDTRASILKERKTWQHVLRVLEDEEMPPEDPLPTSEERGRLVRWVDDTINNIDWSQHRHAGHVTIPRLTREEYNNTLRDLIGLDLRPGDLFSADGQGESGFDNDRDALSVTPALLEKSLIAADRAMAAVLALDAESIEILLESENMFMTETGEKARHLGDDFFGYVITRGQMTLYESVNFPYDGFYEFTIRAKSTAGPTGARLRIDNRRQADIKVPSQDAVEYTVTCFVPSGSHQMTWNINKPAVPPTPKSKPAKKSSYTKLPKDANKIVTEKSATNAPRWPLNGDESKEVAQLIRRLNARAVGVQRPYEWLRLHGINGHPAQLTRFGTYIDDRQPGVDSVLKSLADELGITAKNAFQQWRKHNRERLADNENLYDMPATVELEKSQKPGNVAIDWVRVHGPVRPTAADPIRDIFFTQPGDDVPPQAAAKAILARFSRRAFRRPVADEELQPYLTLFQRGQARGDDFRPSVSLALTGILASPKFLFREELVSGKSDEPLDDYALASRLSYFLWLSMPDEELFKLAESNRLHEPAVLRKQVRRMLVDPKSRAFTKAFLRQWLGYANLGSSVIPDAERFPEFTDELNAAMQDEPVLMFESLLRDGGSLLELLDTDRTFVNEVLSRHYGIHDVTGEVMRPVLLTDANRGGLLGMGSVLTATSSPTRTSPVVRGQWILETLLGDPAGDPPPDAGALPGDAGQKKGLTLREELLEHRRNPSCAACHDRLDPLGFGLENFDAIGRYRTQQNDRPIDATGQLPDGTTFVGPAELKKYLLEHRRDDFLRNLAEQTLGFALGRSIEYYDEPAITRIVKAVESADNDAATLMIEVVLSYPFLHQNNQPDPE